MKQILKFMYGMLLLASAGGGAGYFIVWFLSVGQHPECFWGGVFCAVAFVGLMAFGYITNLADTDETDPTSRYYEPVCFIQRLFLLLLFLFVVLLSWPLLEYIYSNYTQTC